MSVAKAIAITNAINDTTNDSVRNCLMSCFLVPPTTFLIPISLLRFKDCATARFIKLIQAIIKIKTAMQVSMYE